MMRKFLSIIILLIFQISFSQSKFEKMPEETNEIHFKCKLSSKIQIDENGVYADSLFFKTYFPKTNYSKVAKPKAYYLNSKVELTTLRKSNKRKLIAVLYHNNETYKGIHFIEQSKTFIIAERNDEELKTIFKNYFGEEYAVFQYKIDIDYSKKIKHVLYPNAYHQFGFDEIQKEIDWTSKTKGVFVEKVKKKRYTNAVTFDENLSKYISMGYIFKNSDFGVSKIESFESTLELIEVKYK